jgi:hypothetical protein
MTAAGDGPWLVQPDLFGDIREPTSTFPERHRTACRYIWIHDWTRPEGAHSSSHVGTTGSTEVTCELA